MRFALEDFLADKSQCQAVTEQCFRRSVDDIRKRKLISQLSKNSLNHIKESLSWVLGYRINMPLHFVREQNLYNAVEAEIIRRQNETS